MESWSALWEALHASAKFLPVKKLYSQIILKQEVGEMYKDVFPMMPVSPVKNPRVKEIWTDSGSLQKGRELLSPISVHERYSSPMAGSAKRLFGEDFPQRKYLRTGS